MLSNLMKPTTFQQFSKRYQVKTIEYGFYTKAVASWIVSGESRLSYTTIIRLSEFCREYHWHKDLVVDNSFTNLDSITKSIEAEFFSPIHVNNWIAITYQVAEVRRKGYKLAITISDKEGGRIYAKINMISVFFDEILGSSVEPPLEIINILKHLQFQFFGGTS